VALSGSGGTLGVAGSISSLQIGEGFSTFSIGGAKGFDVPFLVSGGVGRTTRVSGSETPCRSWDPSAIYY